MIESRIKLKNKLQSMSKDDLFLLLGECRRNGLRKEKDVKRHSDELKRHIFLELEDRKKETK